MRGKIISTQMWILRMWRIYRKISLLESRFVGYKNKGATKTSIYLLNLLKLNSKGNWSKKKSWKINKEWIRKWVDLLLLSIWIDNKATSKSKAGGFNLC